MQKLQYILLYTTCMLSSCLGDSKNLTFVRCKLLCHDTNNRIDCPSYYYDVIQKDSKVSIPPKLAPLAKINGGNSCIEAYILNNKKWELLAQPFDDTPVQNADFYTLQYLKEYFQDKKNPNFDPSLILDNENNNFSRLKTAFKDYQSKRFIKTTDTIMRLFLATALMFIFWVRYQHWYTKSKQKKEKKKRSTI